VSASAPIDLGNVRTALARHAPTLIAPDPEQRRASVALIVREVEGRVELLLIQRALREGDPWSGHMALPGGRQEAGDADELWTARRETLEEVGLDLTSSVLLGRLDDTPAVARARPIPMTIAAFVFELIGDAPLVLSAEVVETLWVPLDDLLGTALLTRVDFQVESVRYELPAWNIQGRVVWGLTYRMVSLLIAAIRAPEPPSSG
jgi:8-oxo-dGTP pyrophosphatase MutT (NUDIX family)